MKKYFIVLLSLAQISIYADSSICDEINTYSLQRAQLIKDLIKGAEVDNLHQCPSLALPLGVAANRGPSALVSYLLETDARKDINRKSEVVGHTPLMEAALGCASNHEAPVIVQMLLDAGADPSIKDNHLRTPKTALELMDDLLSGFSQLPVMSEASCSLVSDMLSVGQARREPSTPWNAQEH